MMNDDILDGLTQVVADLLDQPDLRLARDTTADEVQGWDSVNHINIVVAAEEKFHVKFRTAELDEIRNVGDFVDLIQKKIAKKQS
jgi:acyl carrier protein